MSGLSFRVKNPEERDADLTAGTSSGALIATSSIGDWFRVSSSCNRTAPEREIRSVLFASDLASSPPPTAMTAMAIAARSRLLIRSPGQIYQTHVRGHRPAQRLDRRTGSLTAT